MAITEILERCFLPLERRVPPRPCFVRIIGQTAGLPGLLERYERLARPCGACFQDGIANPTEGEISRLYAAVGERFTLDRQLLQRHMTLWLGQLRPEGRQALSNAMFQSLEQLRRQGCNDNILKNAYVKFMCWLRGPFGHVLSALGRSELPKLLYRGRISKYEVLILYMLHQAGCDVWYVHPSTEEFYRKGDPEGRFSQLVQGPPAAPPAPSPKPAPAPRPAPSPKPAPAPRPAPAPKPAPAPAGPAPWESARTASLNGWAAGLPPWEAALLPSDKRGAGEQRRALLAACLGADERAVYRNRLFGLKRGLEDSGRTCLLLDKKLPAPSAAATAPFMQLDRRLPRGELIRALARCLTPACAKEYVLLARKVFVQVMDRLPDRDPVRCFNHGVRLACWLEEYARQLFPAGGKAQPALLCYGPAPDSTLSLLWALANMGADVLWFCPDAGAQGEFSRHFLAGDWLVTTFDGSLPPEPFPQREERVRAGTTAYNASRELDQLLHSDTGMFRDRQFTRSQPVTLRTTYDEVEQLWREEAQFRPSFQAKSGVVYVPNLFVKISGVDKGEVDRYWNQIRTMRTPETYLVTTVPFLKTAPAMSAAQAAAFLHDGKLDPKALKASRFYQYDYLPDDTQDYILEKIQALIDYDLIINGGSDLPASILSTLMDLDKELLRLLQQFDFTRTIPKFIAVDVTENLFSLEECILLAFLNLTGFDIAVFTPTGYRNLEKYLRPDSFDTLVAGAFQFDLVVPSLYGGSRGGWLDRIFRGG